MAKKTVDNLILVSRADPIICGHATETRNLAEAALELGIKKVDLVTWPNELIDSNKELPKKNNVLPYSEGIFVHRPSPVGDYKILDGRYTQALTGKVLDILHESKGKTAIMDLYLSPHSSIVSDALAVLKRDQRQDVVSISEAVGSDITNVVKNAVNKNAFGAAQLLLHSYSSHDIKLAVSRYTKDEIVKYASLVDNAIDTSYAKSLEKDIRISYPAVDIATYTNVDGAVTKSVLEKRNLKDDGYILFLSRITSAKGVDDIIRGFKNSKFYDTKQLVIAGSGPLLPEMKSLAADDKKIIFMDDVADSEKPHLMSAAYTFIFPTKPRPEFVETLGIVLVEYMLAGRRPLITCATGGVPEATGGHCLYVPTNDPAAITGELDALERMSNDELSSMVTRGRNYVNQTFNRVNILQNILSCVSDHFK